MALTSTAESDNTNSNGFIGTKGTTPWIHHSQRSGHGRSGLNEMTTIE
jgi:hypothetical protein